MVRQQKNEELMAAGVTLIDPATTYIDADVVVGADTVIHPCVFLEGGTKIGAACEIHAGARIVNSTIGDRVCVRNHTVVTDSTVDADASIGPFAHICAGREGRRARAHRQLRRAQEDDAGRGAKANHLAYLGDATIGAKANVGAGTITCNYDGEKKHQTVIEARRFVGSNSTLVAPVTLADGSYVAAGSAVTTDVPAGALAIARGRQENKDGWVAKQGRTTAQAKQCTLERCSICAESSDTSAEAGRAGPDRGPAPPRISRLRLGGRRGRQTARSKCGAAPASWPISRTRSPKPLAGVYGLGHTRWATHGRPTEENAHPAPRLLRPHRRRPQRHHRELPRDQARAAGRRATSSSPKPTPKVVAHLVEKEWKNDGLENAVLRAMKRVRGLFALVLLSADDPEKLVAVRNGPPIVVGLGDGE